MDTSDGKPPREVLLAVGKFGWSCDNYDIETIERSEAEKLQPTLSDIDMKLGTIVKNGTGEVGEVPYFKDVLELGLTAVAHVNTILRSVQPPDADDDSDGVQKFLSDRELHREFLVTGAYNDEFVERFIVPLANEHYDLGITAEEIDNFDTGSLPPMLQQEVNRSSWRESEDSNFDFGDLRDVADLYGSHKYTGSDKVARTIHTAELDATSIEAAFYRVKNAGMPWVLSRPDTTVPNLSGDQKEQLLEKLVGVLNSRTDDDYVLTLESARENAPDNN